MGVLPTETKVAKTLECTIHTTLRKGLHDEKELETVWPQAVFLCPIKVGIICDLI